ncbi:MAG: hypothetical protein ACTSV1_03275 [Alphaproteobacteria bacterium]
MSPELEALAASPKPAPTASLLCRTDWEQVFEDPESGIISLVERARSVNAYRKSVGLIVQALLVRDDDAPLRVELEARLEGLLGDNDNGANGIETAKDKAITVLRDIKTYRQKKSDECGTRKKQDEDRRVTGQAAVAETEEARSDEIGGIFADALGDFISRRLEAVCADENQEQTGKPAFIVSHIFAGRFDAIVRAHIAPHILENSRGLVRRIAEQPVDDRRRFVTAHFESRNGRADMWEKWQKSWAELTLPKALPARPEENKSTGLLGLFKSKNKNKKSWKRELTVDEWKQAAREIKAENKKAARLWADICAPDDAYQSPTDDDGKLLMDLFARGEKALQERTAGLRQIVEQGGGSVARNLVKFIGTKDMDLSLLAISCRKPDLFLGPDGALRDMIKGFDEGEAEENFPLTMRYLSGKI